jgi:steroid delta-isomerase-like uncharacterized protein
MATERTETSTEENKALTRRVFEEIWNQGNYDLADELIDPNFVDHDSAMPEEVSGIEGFKEFVSMYRSGFSDTHIVVEDQVAEEDKVVTRWMATGTHDGDFWGLAPTGKRVEITGMEIARISGGKIAEIWDNYDVMGLMQQIGALPSGAVPSEE